MTETEAMLYVQWSEENTQDQNKRIRQKIKSFGRKKTGPMGLVET